ERELVPRLDADDRVLLDGQLDTALLPTEAAVRLDQPFRGAPGVGAHVLRVRSGRPEFVDHLAVQRRDGQGWRDGVAHGLACSSHGWKFSASSRSRGPWPRPALAGWGIGNVESVRASGSPPRRLRQARP